jgi:hypothetical protein
VAYLDDKPTDSFIASVLAGGDDLTGMGMWFPGRPLHYREITRSVETAMHGAYSRLPAAARDHPTILSGVGVQNRKPRHRHVAFRAVVSRFGVSHFELADRHQPRHRFSTMQSGHTTLGFSTGCGQGYAPKGWNHPRGFATS